MSAGPVLSPDAVGMGSTNPADYGDLGALRAPQSRYQERVEHQQQVLLNGGGSYMDGGVQHLNGSQQLDGSHLNVAHLHGSEQYP